MNTVLTTVLLAAAGYLVLLVSWVLYLAVMHLKKVRHDLHPFAKANAYAILAVGLPLDVAVNWVLGSVIFAEPPRELFLTTRMKRLKEDDRGWRADVAWWVCEHLLNQFDREHC